MNSTSHYPICSTTSASESPEEILVLAFVGSHKISIGKNYIYFKEIVNSQTICRTH